MPEQVHKVLPAEVPVLIAGGGPVGLTLAALLARHGVQSLVVEADEGYCTGSRAICISRRSQEIMGWVGADDALVQTGLSWVGGRSYWRGTEVLHFEMPSEPTQRFAPMVNIQQYSVEQFAHEAGQRQAAAPQVAFGHRVVSLNQLQDHVDVQVADAAGRLHNVRASWLVACDGGRSTVREELGLKLEGTQYDGKYVIVDIVQKTKRDIERLAWFDPPSNPGSTILMHRQPGEVWRIDYQIRDDEDPAKAIKPENVLPRVQSHLAMIGEDEPWEPLWISIYNAKCLTLSDYRHGRIFFAGDAAHLVPIFGVRGLNSGLDDAGNLAWKLAHVMQGQAGDALLDTYTNERLHAARENIAYGAKSTEFMAPPNFAFALMREATLRLSVVDAKVQSLINPRQSAPVAYDGSSLNMQAPATGWTGWTSGTAAPGKPAPEAQLQGGGHLTSCFGARFTLLAFTDAAVNGRAPEGFNVVQLKSGEHQAWERYGVATSHEALVLVRPDGYVMARWHGLPFDEASAFLQARLNPTAGATA